MDIQEEFENWVIKENIHPRIDLREEEGSYLCDDDYEGNGNLMVSADSIAQFIKKQGGKLKCIRHTLWEEQNQMLTKYLLGK